MRDCRRRDRQSRRTSLARHADQGILNGSPSLFGGELTGDEHQGNTRARLRADAYEEYIRQS
jgi:hypothetical protein